MAYTRIASTTVSGSSTNTVTFSSIPQTYEDLVLFSCIRTSVTSQVLGSFVLSFNADETSQQEQRINSNNNSVSASTASNPAFYVRGTTDFASSNAFGASITLIADYTNTSYAKTHSSRSITINNNTSINQGYIFSTVGRWAVGSAITSLRMVREDSGVFVAGTTFDLYGVI